MYLNNLSLSDQILSFKDEVINLRLPEFNDFKYGYNVVLKIKVKKILSEKCFIKFIIKVSLIYY